VYRRVGAFRLSTGTELASSGGQTRGHDTKEAHMRAHTEGKHEMGKRFAVVIGVAAAGVMALGAQTALAGGEPVDSTPPDLQLSFSGKETQHVAIGARTDCGQKWPPYVCGGCDHGACAITVKASCGASACTARGEGTLTKVKNEELRTASTDLAPGETSGLEMYMTKKTRKKAGKALDEGEKVKAKVTVKATDAAGNVATAKRTIRLGVAHSHYVK
jgi:hypothetical protein